VKRNYKMGVLIHNSSFNPSYGRVEKIETSKAKRMSGVHAVISGQTPGADLTWTYSSRGTSKQSKLFDPHCRFEGDAVAAVAAETPYLA
jgi:xanthine dehydrogenase YagR molybdenum-binding subunit